MVRMLVTRPEPDASETAARLAALGIEAVLSPLLVAETLPAALPPPAGFAAIAVTSANALRALHDRGDLPRLRALPVYAVGDRTAAMARDYGFAEVLSAAGDFHALVALVARAGLTGPLLYPAARHQSGDLAAALAPFGLLVITVPVYAMNPARRLVQEANLDAALFYSRRTAETYVALAGDDKASRQLGMLCMSEAVAEPLLAAHFVRVSLAEHPSEMAMMALALSFAREQKAGMIKQ
jgi:uroporphyrinogen-III synthase